MKTLQELVQIVNRNKLKAIDIIDLQAEGNTKTSELYNLIVDQKVDSDAGAVEMMYPNAATTTGYRKVKAKLKSKLLSALFFIDAKKSSYSDRKRAFYECYRDWAAARLLMAKNAFSTSLKLALKVLSYAEKYEFTDLAMEASRFLRLYYSTIEGDRKEFMHYQSVFERYRALYQIECEIEHYYTDLLVYFVNSRSFDPDTQARIDKAYALCSPLIEQYDSYSVQLYGTLIGLIVHSSRADHQAALALCEKSRAIFEQKEYEAETPLQIIYYQSLVCHIQLQQFEKGRSAAEKCLSFSQEGTFNWFKYKELYLLLCTRTGCYQEALDILRDTIDHPRFPHLTESAKEIWKIFEAYILFALWVRGDRKIFQKMKFRSGRFLNETPIFSKDKRGLNVAILIAQFMLLLCEGKYDRMIDRAEALQKYGVRYLQDDDTIRSFYFIKLILVVVKCSFLPEESRDAGLKYFNQLSSNLSTEVKQLHQIEIIPYEALWEMILKTLPNQSSSISA